MKIGAINFPLEEEGANSSVQREPLVSSSGSTPPPPPQGWWRGEAAPLPSTRRPEAGLGAGRCGEERGLRPDVRPGSIACAVSVQAAGPMGRQGSGSLLNASFLGAGLLATAPSPPRESTKEIMPQWPSGKS